MQCLTWEAIRPMSGKKQRKARPSDIRHSRKQDAMAAFLSSGPETAAAE